MPPARTGSVALALSLSLAVVVGCGARNVIGELPDGGSAGSGGGLAGAGGGAPGGGAASQAPPAFRAWPVLARWRRAGFRRRRRSRG